MNRSQKDRFVGRSLQQYLRGIAGGLMFSLPLLYTMLEIAFLPRHFKRKGWVTFPTDPRTVEETKARVWGFEQP